MKRVILTAIISIATFTCVFAQKSEIENNFEQFKNSFIDQLWQHNPEWATLSGYHVFDGEMSKHNAIGNKMKMAFAESILQIVEQFPDEKLSTENQIDKALMINSANSLKWSLTAERRINWDPTIYNPYGVFYYMLTEQYAPLEERLRAINKRLMQLPEYFYNALENLQNPVRELQDLAINQMAASESFYTKDLLDSIKISKLPQAEKDAQTKLLIHILNVHRDYVMRLKNLKSPQHRPFQLGGHLYAKKFKYDNQSQYAANEIHMMASRRMSELHTEMYKIAKALWPKYKKDIQMPADTLEIIKQVIYEISLNHTTADNFQNAIEKQIPQLEKFVKDKNLLYIDPTKPLIVRKEPAYMAGVAGASINAPGPYDKNGNTYYNVGSLAGWPKEKAESYLREYNDYTLQILNIHEAIPGHYTQLVYANKTPNLLRSILANGAMIEGWAVYSELLMLENGYGDNQPEMWLMWYKWHLRTVCNTILDYSVHNNTMGKDQAIDFLTNYAFQEKAEAEGKWNRVNYTSVQLTSYYTGFQEIYNLREEMKSKLGSKFDIKKFNESFLSYGNIPVKYIRMQMLKNLN